jgi:hypothetical protein
LLAEIVASDASLLATFNQAIEAVIQNNQKARQNPIEHEISIGKAVAKRRRKWNSIG